MSAITAFEQLSPSILEIGTVFLCLTAILAYINKRWFGLPATIGVTAISLFISLLGLVLSQFGFGKMTEYQGVLLEQLNFTDILLNGMLSMLLFAGAMHINFSELKKLKLPIMLLAFVGTTVSAVLVATLVYFILPFLGFNIPFLWCLLFGALISPTDPIAVLAILKSAGTPKCLETVISGESLLNDGVGVVLFTLLIGMLHNSHIPTLAHVGYSLLWEAGGGIAFGIAVGYLVYYLIKNIDGPHEEVLLTLAGVLGGYMIANRLHMSGPLAMVAMGVVVGNVGKRRGMSAKSSHYIDLFWELLDEMLNAILFVLIGLEIVTVAFSGQLVWAGIVAIIIALLARVSVTGLITRKQRDNLGLPIGSWKVLTWGGLRGGISFALVLQLPDGAQKELLMAMTYAIVIFSILVQGLTIGRVAKGLTYNPINKNRMDPVKV